MTSLVRCVCGIVVTYQPEFSGLKRLLDQLLRQGLGHIVVVDNGSTSNVVEWVEKSFGRHIQLSVIPLEDNFGIAHAQNVGIAHARNQVFDYVILFDQDSEPSFNMVEYLLLAAIKTSVSGVCAAAFGPRYMDERQNNPPPFIRVSGFGIERLACSTPDAIVEVDYLIASGCLIPVSVLDAVGEMREELFIDYVDIEWGLRARAAGFRSFGVCRAQMKHDLGDVPIEFMGRKVPLHSPLRHYYHFRNAVWMYFHGVYPLHWKLVDGWRLLLKYGFYSLFARPRALHWWMMTQGIWHGLRAQMGRRK